MIEEHRTQNTEHRTREHRTQNTRTKNTRTKDGEQRTKNEEHENKGHENKGHENKGHENEGQRAKDKRTRNNVRIKHEAPRTRPFIGLWFLALGSWRLVVVSTCSPTASAPRSTSPGCRCRPILRGSAAPRRGVRSRLRPCQPRCSSAHRSRNALRQTRRAVR